MEKNELNYMGYRCGIRNLLLLIDLFYLGKMFCSFQNTSHSLIIVSFLCLNSMKQRILFFKECQYLKLKQKCFIKSLFYLLPR